jgi:hypothetical protein
MQQRVVPLCIHNKIESLIIISESLIIISDSILLFYCFIYCNISYKKQVLALSPYPQGGGLGCIIVAHLSFLLSNLQEGIAACKTAPTELQISRDPQITHNNGTVDRQAHPVTK